MNKQAIKEVADGLRAHGGPHALVMSMQLVKLCDAILEPIAEEVKGDPRIDKHIPGWTYEQVDELLTRMARVTLFAEHYAETGEKMLVLLERNDKRQQEQHEAWLKSRDLTIDLQQRNEEMKEALQSFREEMKRQRTQALSQADTLNPPATLPTPTFNRYPPLDAPQPDVIIDRKEPPNPVHTHSQPEPPPPPRIIFHCPRCGEFLLPPLHHHVDQWANLLHKGRAFVCRNCSMRFSIYASSFPPNELEEQLTNAYKHNQFADEFESPQKP